MKKVKLFLNVIVILLLILLVGYFIQDKFLIKTKQIYIEYGDEFPNIKIIDSKNIQYNIKDKLTGKVNLICYVNKYCSSCMEELSLINKLLYTDAINEKISIILLWKDEIPVSNLMKNNIDAKLNYSLNNKYELGNSTPCFYFVENEVICFKTNETNKLINKIFSYINIEKLQKSVLLILQNEVGSKKNNFLFLTENCEECLKLKNKNFDKDLYLITDYEDKDSIFDKYDFFKNVFNIHTYPTLLKIDNEKFQILDDFDYIISELH